MFISASAMEYSDAQSYDEFWHGVGGGATKSGVRVNATTAMQLSIAYACNRVLSQTMAQMPLFTFKQLEDGGKERDKNNPLYDILKNQVNEFMTSYEWRENQQTSLNFRGNGFSKIVYLGNGNIDSLWPLHPDKVRVQRLRTGQIRYEYDNPLTNKTEIILWGEMLHLRDLTINGLTGLNPVHAMREALGGAIAARDYGNNYWRNSAIPPAYIEYDGDWESGEDKDTYGDTWSKKFGGDNRHRMAVLNPGMRLKTLDVKNKDAQWMEGRKYSDVDVARIWRMQPHKVGILDKATFSNIEHQAIEFITDTITPQAKLWEQVIRRDLLIDDNEIVSFIMNSLLRGDIKSRYEAYASGIATGGWLTRNEVRILEDLNPEEGLDNFLVPLNLAPVDEERANALAMKAAERVVNKAVIATGKAYAKHTGDPESFKAWVEDFYSKHAEFTSDVLVTSSDVGERYAEGSKEMILGAIAAEGAGHAGLVNKLLTEWSESRAHYLADLGVFNNE